MSRVKLYSSAKNKWFSTDENGRKIVNQIEYGYMEYDTATGDVIASGTEDFSLYRATQFLLTKYVYIWDGKTYNKGGHRRFTENGLIRYNRGDGEKVKKLLKTRFKNAVVIELR